MVAAAAQKLGSLVKQAPYMGPQEALDAIEETLNSRALCLSHPFGLQKVANLDRLAILAQTAQQRGTTSLVHFVDELRFREARSQREPQGVLHHAQQIAVTLSSVHASKGLQYPVVLLAGVDRKTRGDTSALLYDHEDGLVFRPSKGSPALESCRFRRAKERKAALEQAERARLLYVAVTRAKHHVAFIGPPPEQLKSAGFAAFLKPWMKSAQEQGVLDVMDSGDITFLRKAPQTKKSEEAPLPQAAVVTSPVSPSSRPTKQISRLAINAIDLARSLTSKEASLAPAPKKSATPHRGAAQLPLMPLGALTPQAQGTLLHDVLRHLDVLPQNPDAKQRQQFVDASLKFLGHDPHDPMLVVPRARLHHFLTSQPGQAICRIPASQRWSEYSFTRSICVPSGELIVRGQIDLVVQTEEALWLVDFKSAPSQAGEAHYRAQLEIYGWALRETLELKPYQCLVGQLVYLDSAHISDVPLGPSEHDAISNALLAYAERTL